MSDYAAECLARLRAEHVACGPFTTCPVCLALSAARDEGAQLFAHLLSQTEGWAVLSDDRGDFRAILEAAAKGKKAWYADGIYHESDPT